MTQSPNRNNRFGDLAPSEYPGERLGLPKTGPGSIARLPRRIGAIILDWVLAMAISHWLTADNSFATLGIFALCQILFIPTLGGSIGHLVFGMRVAALTGTWVGPLKPLIRTVLLCLVIPLIVWDSDQRGFHDKIAGTVLIEVR